MPLKPNCSYQTNQGKIVWIEALKFLQNQKPLHPFELNEGLSAAAKDHIEDMVKYNFFGHDSFDGTKYSKRI